MPEDWGSFMADAENNSKPRTQCKVCNLLDELSISGRMVVIAALNRPELSARAIQRALASRVAMAAVPSESSIRRHRRAECEDGASWS
jgi:hypothetical protein